MTTPRTLKSALEADYVICKLYAKYNKKIRVTVKERYHQADRKMFLEFWIDRECFKRNHTQAYDLL